MKTASLCILLTSLSLAASAAAPDLKATAAKIDELVNSKLAKEKITPNKAASDEIFVRRVYLDVVGRIPTLQETTLFLKNSDPDKRAKLIDELLASEGYVQNFFNYWADILRMKSQMIGGGQSLPAFYGYANWLKSSLRDNKPYDQMVREAVTADGKSYENGAIGFYIRDYNMPLDNMAVTTQIFLGTSMVCAQCHNHPFDKWTQMDYYQMAAHTYGMTGSNGLTNPLLAQAIYGGGERKGGKDREKPLRRHRLEVRSARGHRAQGCGPRHDGNPPPAALQHRAGSDRQEGADPAARLPIHRRQAEAEDRARHPRLLQQGRQDRQRRPAAHHLLRRLDDEQGEPALHHRHRQPPVEKTHGPGPHRARG
jgi:hypothetical protein